MIEDVLARIEKRLTALGLKAAAASRQAGLSEDAIRNLRRAAKGDVNRHGTSTRTIELLAPVLQTTPGWLMDGVGDEDATTPSYVIPVMGYVGAGAKVEPEFEQVPAEGLDTIELPFAIPQSMIAFMIKGDSMLPVYHDGDAVIVYRDQMRRLETFYGEEAVVLTVDGTRYLKTILRGDGDTVTLNSFNARPMEDIELSWIGEIYVTIRARQLRRMAKIERTTHPGRTFDAFQNAHFGDGA